MKSKILAQLKAKATGVSTEVLAGVADWLATTVTQDDQIETSVAGVIPLLNVLQSENDRRVTAFQQENSALKTEISKLKGEKPKGEPDDKDVPEWAKELVNQNRALLQEVTTLKSEHTAKTHQEKLIAKLKEAEIPEKFYKVAISGRSFKDDTEIETLVGEITTNYKEYAQELADQGLGLVPKPTLNVKPADKEKVPETVKTYIDTKFPTDDKAGVTNLGGKKL